MGYFSDKQYILDRCQCPIYYMKNDNSDYVFNPPITFPTILYKNQYMLFLRFHKQLGFVLIEGQGKDVYVDIYNCISLYATDNNHTYARLPNNLKGYVQIPVFPLTPSKASDHLDVQKIDSTFADAQNHMAAERNAVSNTDIENEYAPPRSVLDKVIEGITHYLGENNLCFRDKTLCRSFEVQREPKDGEDFTGTEINYETLQLRNEFKPHGVCAITGEYIHETVSSLQRLLIVNIEKNTFDRALLKFFQDNPMYLPYPYEILY